MTRGLDEALREWDWHEVHTRVVAGSPEDALAALAGAPVATGLAAWLLRVRGLRPAGSVLEALGGIGLTELSRSPAEIVLGACGAPWRVRDRLGEFASPRPNSVLIACDLRAEPLAGGRALLSTETRVKAVDARARRAFGRYWRIVGPWSGVIRRSWLRSADGMLGEP
ncbi:MAG: hypothetical protein ACKVUT_17690 [Gaiella sp.]